MYVCVRISFDCRFWENLCDRSASPQSVGQNETIISKLRTVVCRLPPHCHSLPHPLTLDLPADSEPFDWQHKVKEVDPIPTFVRPGKPESPVDINFDHSQAAFGNLVLIIPSQKPLYCMYMGLLNVLKLMCLTGELPSFQGLLGGCVPINLGVALYTFYCM